MKENIMTVQLLTKPACVACTQTKRALDRLGVEYTTIDITEDENALQTAKDLGYMQAPVVIAGDDHWSGFQPDRIKTLAN